MITNAVYCAAFFLIVKLSHWRVDDGVRSPNCRHRKQALLFLGCKIQAPALGTARKGGPALSGGSDLDRSTPDQSAIDW
jgi:hypothetical protein